MDEHVSVLLFCVFVVEDEATVLLLDERTLDVASVGFHDFANVAEFFGVSDLAQLLPRLFVSGFV